MLGRVVDLFPWKQFYGLVNGLMCENKRLAVIANYPRGVSVKNGWLFRSACFFRAFFCVLGRGNCFFFLAHLFAEVVENRISFCSLSARRYCGCKETTFLWFVVLCCPLLRMKTIVTDFNGCFYVKLLWVFGYILCVLPTSCAVFTCCLLLGSIHARLGEFFSVVWCSGKMRLIASY